MRRSYGINETEWDLIFYAPLTSDLNETVHNIIGTSNANIHTFDADKGLRIKTTSVGQYGVKYTLPQSFKDAVSTTGQIRLLSECVLYKVSGGTNVWRMDNTNSDTDTNNPVLVNQMGTIAFNTSRLNLPSNVSLHIYEDQTCDFTNMSAITGVTTVWSDYDGRSFTMNLSMPSNYYKVRPQQCPYFRILHAINRGGIGEHYIKDLKIYRYKG